MQFKVRFFRTPAAVIQQSILRNRCNINNVRHTRLSHDRNYSKCQNLFIIELIASGSQKNLLRLRLCFVSVLQLHLSTGRAQKAQNAQKKHSKDAQTTNKVRNYYN